MSFIMIMVLLVKYNLTGGGLQYLDLAVRTVFVLNSPAGLYY